MGAIPILLWAHEYGPDAGYYGVPKENGNLHGDRLPCRNREQSRQPGAA